MSSILLARITGAHGIRGEVKIRSFTDDPKAFATYGPLQTADGTEVNITRLKPAKDEFICTLMTVTDRNAAEALKGIELFVDRTKLPPEPLLADLVGRPVTHKDQPLGTIAGFQNFGAGELMELDNGLLIPARFITSDAVTVDLPDGFLDKE
jgi:16S rRNA processing protein RimM